MPRFVLTGALALLAHLAAAANADTPASEVPATLTTVAQLRQLTVEEARLKRPVSVRGVVTAAEPDWGGRFFLQDETAGVFVNASGTQPAIGTYVQVDGVSSPGSFARGLIASRWERLGLRELPVARPANMDRLMTGAEDGIRVELRGQVRAAEVLPDGKVQLDFASEAYRLRIYPKLAAGVDPQSLIAARVRVRGTAATSFNAARRQLTAVNIYVPTAGDFEVETLEQVPPFEQAMVPLADVARYRPDANLGERLHVAGTVTFQRRGQDLFIQDETGGLQVESRQNLAVPLGARVEAIGFLEVVNFQPVLRDTVFRLASGESVPPQARLIDTEALRTGLHAAELVTLRGTLLHRSVHEVVRPAGSFAGSRVICTIQAANTTFAAECEIDGLAGALTEIPLGSTVELTGIPLVESGDNGRMRTFRLLMPAPDRVRLLAAPSWFTARRLWMGFGGACALLAVAAVWSVTVTRKNAMLRTLAAERAQARDALQQAHDELELRVRERTEQLKFEMSARKASELESRVVLAERTRLARELHDTLEQELTGIALQLDTATKLFRRSPEDASARIDLAREFLRRSQRELRESIWGLRTRELEQFDLVEALARSGRKVADNGGIRVETATAGEPRRLPETVEANLLRVAQEALTNVLKHSGATEVRVELAFDREGVVLEVTDNGRGLGSAQADKPREGRFGLLGMGERVKGLGGRLEVNEATSGGTMVRASIPLEAGVA